MAEEKQRYAMIAPQWSDEWLAVPWDELPHQLDPMEDGEVMKVESRWLTPAEVEAMPEFQGW